MLDQPLRLFNDHFGHLDMAYGRLVEGRADDLALDRAHHVGDLLRPLVDQQDDEIDLRMTGGDGVGDVLQHHRLAGPRGRHDKPPLTLAERRDDIDDPGGDLPVGRILDLEFQALFRIKRGQIVEIYAMMDLIGGAEVDGVDLEHGKVTLTVLGRPDPSLDRVPGPEPEAPDLAGRSVDIVRTGQVIRLRRAEKAEAILQDFKGPAAGDRSVVVRQLLEDGEHHVLLAQAAGVLDPQLLGVSQQVGRRFRL